MNRSVHSLSSLQEYDRLLMSGGARAVPVNGSSGSMWTALLRRPVSLSGWPWTAFVAVATVVGAVAAGLAVDRSVQAVQKRRFLGDDVWPYVVASMAVWFAVMLVLTWIWGGSMSVSSSGLVGVAAVALFFVVQANFVENVHRLIPN